MRIHFARGPKWLVLTWVVALTLILGAAAQAAELVNIAYPAARNLTDAPSLIAAELMLEDGFDVVQTFYNAPELAVQAVVRGNAHVAAISLPAALAAIQAGAPVRIFAEQSGNEWGLGAKKSIQSMNDLNGATIAVHSETSISNGLVQWLIKEEGISPQVLIVPGSAVRVQALMAGQIDASALLLPDAVKLTMERPDDFHVLFSWASKLPDVMATVYISRTDLLENRSDIHESLIRRTLEVHHRIHEDIPYFLGKIGKYFGDLDPDFLNVVAEEYVRQGVFRFDLGVNSGQPTVEFAFETGQIEGTLGTYNESDYYDFRVLRRVLGE